jgi:hypothetical protein
MIDHGRLPKRPECGGQFLGEELRLLPGREVVALVGFVDVDEERVAAMRVRSASSSAWGMSTVNGRIAVPPSGVSVVTAMMWISFFLAGDDTKPARLVCTSHPSNARVYPLMCFRTALRFTGWPPSRTPEGGAS